MLNPATFRLQSLRAILFYFSPPTTFRLQSLSAILLSLATPPHPTPPHTQPIQSLISTSDRLRLASCPAQVEVHGETSGGSSETLVVLGPDSELL